MNFRNVILLLISVVTVHFSFGQDDFIGIGEWRVHPPYGKAQIVEVANNRVYGASDISLFYFDQDDNSLNKLSKINEFSEVGITALGHYPDKNITLFCYTNGNIDILNGSSLYNVNDVKRASISGSKKINNIEFRENFAYLSSDLGVIVLDLIALEVKSTFRNIGPNGSQPVIFDSAINFETDSITLATSDGLLSASLLPQYNLQDFNSWELVKDTNGTPFTGATQVEYFHDTLIFAVENMPIVAMKNGKMYENNLPWESDGSIYFLRATQDKLLLGMDSALAIASSLAEMEVSHVWEVQDTRDGLIDDKGVVWVADNTVGISNNSKGYFKSIKPNGPETSDAFRFYAHENDFITLAGAYSATYVPTFSQRGFYIFEDNMWTTYRTSNNTSLPPTKDLNCAVYNEVTGKYYFGSYGGGILVWDKKDFSVIDENTEGSTLYSVNPPNIKVKVTGLATDKEGNLWITNHESNADNALHKMTPDGVFTSYRLNSNNANFPADLSIDGFGTKWIRIGGSNARSGIVAYDDVNNQERLLTNALGNGGLPVNQVTDLAIDKENAVWVGMTEGVAVFYETENVFKPGSFNATLPIFEGRPLLQDEEINCITIDGGNRKWIGTTNGMFLFDDNGTKALVNFNIDNSPLPSNNINDIGINENTGEIFIATDLGVVSYRGTATEGGETHDSNVLIFPNPVRPDFQGIVGISGLARDATVKITDISGKLIYETNAEGGLATWDTKDLDGLKAKSGIYMVYSSSIDGTDGFVGKIAVIE